MLPIGPLMVEHRWIERVVADVELRLGGQSSKKVDPAYVEQVVDFLRTYADRCHHGKEEDILFRELQEKNLDPTLAALMRELASEHEWARATTRRLVAANVSLVAGGQTLLGEVRRLLSDLASFYPVHIGREDKSFFRPVMAYLSAEEQETMLQEFAQFDASLIHEKYRRAAVDLEEGL